VGYPFLRGPAEDLLHLRADVEPVALGSDLAGVDDRGQVFDEHAVLRLCLAEVVLAIMLGGGHVGSKR
jgi:hypothetical protein